MSCWNTVLDSGLPPAMRFLCLKNFRATKYLSRCLWMLRATQCLCLDRYRYMWEADLDTKEKETKYMGKTITLRLLRRHTNIGKEMNTAFTQYIYNYLTEHMQSSQTAKHQRRIASPRNPFKLSTGEQSQPWQPTLPPQTSPPA
jgi:hypothetical protein